MKNTLGRFLFLMLLIMLTVGYAQGGFAADTTVTAPATGGGWDASGGTLPNFAAGPVQSPFGAQISAALSAMQTAGAAMAGTLVSTGETLLYVFYAITLAWYVYEGMASQQPDMLFKKMISHTMIALIALEMLWGWTGSGGIGITNFLIAGMNTLGDEFTHGGDPADNVIDAYYPAIQSAIGVIYAGVTHLGADMAVCAEPICEIGVFVGEFLLFMVSASFAMLSAGLLAIAMTYALFFANLGDFIIYVGLAVGPIFVATLVFPAAQGFFSKWLEFVISGGMYKLIAVVVGTLLAQILIQIDASTSTLITDNSTLWTGGGSLVELVGVFFLLIFWSLFAYFITKQIPHFVTALTGGANIHLSSMSSLAPSPGGSMPKFGKSKKGASSETAEIKAATAVRTAEIKAASAASTAATKAASKANTEATKAASKANTEATKAATATNKASIKAATDLAKLTLKQSGPKVVGSGSSDGVKN